MLNNTEHENMTANQVLSKGYFRQWEGGQEY